MKHHSILRATFAVLAAALGGTLHAQQQYQWSNFVGKPGGPGNVDGPAAKARFRTPRGIAQDASGNLFVADTFNETIRKITPAGVVSTFAGKAETPGGADGTGGNARFNRPHQLAFGPGGVLYVADRSNCCIRKISPAGVVTTLAGTAGQNGSADGTGAAARFQNPEGLVVDASGNVYVADTVNHTIRKVTPAGVVTTLAGTTGVTGSTDGSGSAALFRYPERITLAGGDLFVTDNGNHTIRKVTLAGVVTTFAGMAGSEGSTDSTGNAARFSSPMGIISDSSGNLFVGQDGDSTLRKITPAGVVSTVAGSLGNGGYGYADGTGPAAKFRSLFSICVAANGVMHVADEGNDLIRRVTPAGVVTTFAGSLPTDGSADGTGTAARFYAPMGMVVNAAGEVWVADQYNCAIRKVTASGVVTTYAGSAGSIGSDDGPVATAKFRYPTGLALGASGNLWVADGSNRTVRLISPAGVVSTVAGMAGQSSIVDGTGADARFNYPSDIAVDVAGNAFVPEVYSNLIRKVTPGGVVTTVAGSTIGGWLDGTGTAARFSYPSAVCTDTSGNLYVPDYLTNVIRKISPTYQVSTLAGTGYSVGSADGAGAAARFKTPNGIAVNGAGTVFVADTYNNTIRRISSTGVVTTIGGTAGIADAQDGMNNTSRFSRPQRLAVGPDGTLYVTDGNNRIAKGVPLADISIEQPAGVNLVDGKNSISYGSVFIGQTATRTFTIRNDSDGFLKGLALSVNGANAADFTPTALGATSLAPGASITFDITFHANTSGTRTAAVHVASSDTDESSFDITLTGSADANPIVVTAPDSDVRYVGGSITFQSLATHPTLPVTYQWKKNSTAIANAKSNNLELSNLTLTSAATYSVVMTAGGKSSTRSATLAVIKPVPAQQVVAKFGSTVKFTVTNTAGLGTFLWKKNSTPIPSSNSKTLTLSALNATTDSSPYFCYMLGSGGAENLVAEFDLSVFDSKPQIVLVQDMPDGAVGSPYSHQIKISAGPLMAPSSYTATNLPPGVTLNPKTGLISGVPTLAKNYDIIVKAINSIDTATTTDTITITPLPNGVIGSFIGMVKSKGILGGNLNGRIDFTAASTGAISGSTTIGTSKYPFAGKLDTTGVQPTAAITIPRANAIALNLNLIFAPDINAIDPTSSMSAGIIGASVTGWRQVWRTTGALPINPATSVAKRYNFALNPPEIAGLPEGSGYGSFTLATNGTLTVTGKTSENDTFTTAGFAGPHGQVLVYQSLYATNGALVGLLDIDPLNSGAPTDTLTGDLTWSRPADSTSRYSPNGFSKIALTAYGARYTAPVAPALILGLTVGVDKAMIEFTGGGISTASINPNITGFDIIAGNKAMPPAALSAGNPGSVKFLTLNATTGEFSGTFTLNDNELRTGAAFVGKKFPRIVPFNGLLTQDNMGPVGAGYFLLPELPTDTTLPTKTVIRSGYVQFQKK
ncbi:MAG: choice-of-anchor D domain-containing protein [Prosthecobacter sp.]